MLTVPDWPGELPSVRIEHAVPVWVIVAAPPFVMFARRPASGLPAVQRLGSDHAPDVAFQFVRAGMVMAPLVMLNGTGSPACLASHMERVSQYTVLAQLPDGKAASLNAGTIRAFRRHGNLPLLTTTADNGKELAAHAELAAQLGLDVYFAQPYHAWERGTNENTNGLVRQFFPKGLDLRQVKPRQVVHVERLLNNRPRKCLGYRTPLEVLRHL